MSISYIIKIFSKKSHHQLSMAAMASTSFSMLGFVGGNNRGGVASGKQKRASSTCFITAAADRQAQGQVIQQEEEKQKQKQAAPQPKQQSTPLEKQQRRQQPKSGEFGVKSKNMSREDGGQWLSSTTRHVRIYAAYIDPVTCAFDQTQTDKLTLILDPYSEFVWNSDTCNKVYDYFLELVDHYEGAPLTEYTLRLIGSDIEHYIRKMLFDGEIKYNMNAKVLNFSMGKPRVIFKNNNDTQLQDVQ